MLYQPPHHEEAQWSGGIPLHILSLNTKWRSVELINQEKEVPAIYWVGSWGDPTATVDNMEKGKIYPCLEIKL
jgi:hypothetical protein